MARNRNSHNDEADERGEKKKKDCRKNKPFILGQHQQKTVPLCDIFKVWSLLSYSDFQTGIKDENQVNNGNVAGASSKLQIFMCKIPAQLQFLEKSI